MRLVKSTLMLAIKISLNMKRDAQNVVYNLQFIMFSLQFRFDYPRLIALCHVDDDYVNRYFLLFYINGNPHNHHYSIASRDDCNIR